MVKVDDTFIGPVSGGGRSGSVTINKTPVVINTVYLKGDKGDPGITPGNYLDCKYLATAPVTSLSSVTLDGSPTPVEGDRALAPLPGAYCAILVYHGGASVIDP